MKSDMILFKLTLLLLCVSYINPCPSPASQWSLCGEACDKKPGWYCAFHGPLYYHCKRRVTSEPRDCSHDGHCESEEFCLKDMPNLDIG